MTDTPAVSAAFSQLAASFQRDAATLDATSFENARATTGTLAMAVLAKDDPELHQQLLEAFDTAANAGCWLTDITPRYNERPIVLLSQSNRALVMHSLAVIQGHSCA